MKKKSKGTPALKKSLARMKKLAKEKDRRYKIQQGIVKKAFGALVRKLGKRKPATDS